MGVEHNHSFVAPRLDNIIDITRPKGSLSEWQKVFALLRRKKMWGHLTTAGLGFGSALKVFMTPGSRCGTFHVAGSATGLGKTFALKLCASIWGDPEAYLVQPSTSERTMMQRAGLLGSLPLIIDEVTAKIREDKEWFPRQVFDYSQGAHKLKGSAAGNAELRDDLHWMGHQIMSSNVPNAEFLAGARKTTSDGEIRRLLEWRARAPIVWDSAEERDTSRLFTDNYGVAGPQFAQWLALNRETARRVCDEAVAHWREYAQADDSERFWTSDCASVIAGYVLAGPKYANVLDMPLAEIMRFLKSLVSEMRRIINTNKVFAIDVLNDYVREHHGQFVKIQGDSPIAKLHNGAEIRPDSARSAIRGRVEYEVTAGFTDFFVEIRMLKAHCAEMNRSYIDFVHDLQGVATVAEVRRDLLANTRGPSLRVKCLKITRASATTDAAQTDPDDQ